MGYGRKAWAVVGYTYAADEFCPDDIVQAMGEHRYANESAADTLDRVAMRRSIDRMDEYTFNSGDFPKVIVSSMVTEDDVCGACGIRLDMW